MNNVAFYTVKAEIESYGCSVADEDFKRPWGGVLVIDENQAQAFANKFLDGIDVESLRVEGKLSPKILIVKPEGKLSWQFHYRRA
jgi:mannose-6-phosphate isomerase